MLHIYYCNDAYKRNWIKLKQITKFSGKEEILNEIPKINVSLIINILLLSKVAFKIISNFKYD